MWKGRLHHACPSCADGEWSRLTNDRQFASEHSGSDVDHTPIGHRRNSWSEMPKTALLCPPTYFDVIDRKNPYMVGASPVDKAKARAQWEGLRGALEAAGVKVETMEPVPGLEDMVFAANQVFVGAHPGIGNFIVPSRMRHPSRQREVAHYVDWFRGRGYKVIEIDFGDEYLEGHGDLIWHPGGSRIYAGHAYRTTIGGIRNLAEAMGKLGIPVVALELVDERFYHLDTSFCPLNEDAVLVCPKAFAKETLEEVRGYFLRVHEITEQEAAAFVGNGIVANGHFLVGRVTANLERILERENLQAVLVDTSEFEKSGGSCFCMKCFLD
jgi:N-dimethylarginine dimethylaminohydrolase